MRVLIIDDHPLIAEGLIISLRDLDPTLEARCVEDRGRALAALDEAPGCDLILLDLSLPDANGLDLLSELRAARPEVPVVILSADDRPETVHAALDAGAMGFISKRSSTVLLIRALQLVLSGGVYVPPQALASMRRGEPAATPVARGPDRQASLAELGLTERQIEVLARIVEGKPTKVICRDLNISEGTAKTHISAILRTLHVTNRTQVLFALSQMGVQLPTLGRGRTAH